MAAVGFVMGTGALFVMTGPAASSSSRSSDADAVIAKYTAADHTAAVLTPQHRVDSVPAPSAMAQTAPMSKPGGGEGSGGGI